MDMSGITSIRNGTITEVITSVNITLLNPYEGPCMTMHVYTVENRTASTAVSTATIVEPLNMAMKPTPLTVSGKPLRANLRPLTSVSGVAPTLVPAPKMPTMIRTNGVTNSSSRTARMMTTSVRRIPA